MSKTAECSYSRLGTETVCHQRAKIRTAGFLCALVVLNAVNLLAKDPAPTVKGADRIIIVKSARTMTLMSGSQVLRTYTVALGAQPVGPKRQAGDHKTPEGEYIIDSKSTQSRFHLALHVSYPNKADRERARRLGVNPGGAIMIHGLEPKYAFLGKLQSNSDWTDGCIAVSNQEIEEIWRLVPVGVPVEIRP